MNIKCIFCFAICASIFFGAATDLCRAASGIETNGWQTKAINSESDLDQVIEKLKVPRTRFDAFQALLEFAGYPKGDIDSGDPKVNAFHGKAIAAMHACPGLDAVVATMIDQLQEPENRLPMLRALLKFSEPVGSVSSTGNGTLDEVLTKALQAASEAFDVPTVEKGLVDSDWLLRITAVECFGNSKGEISAWKRLLPQMEYLATHDDASVRRAADKKLREFPGTEKFLAERLAVETSPDVILELLGNRNQFLRLFIPLLSNRDERVRKDALLFVGFNSHRAPMWQFPFGKEVFDRVIASTRAKSAEERSAATYALTDIRRLDPDLSREAFLRLVDDPSEDVRWRIAAGLVDQYGREDVKRAIARLLKDKSPMVRYMTIVAVGPEKFVPQLQGLARDSDAQVAQWATEKLKQIGRSK